MSNHCLNCTQELTGRYCSACGQKADTHRISFRHFITHDVMHGTFHLEKGMLFTAKQALVRPGKAALDYISGKRVGYYNVFYFILILIGINILLTHYHNAIALDLAPDKIIAAETNAVGEKVDNILAQYGKMLIFMFIPVTAFNSYILFNRKRLNYSEHFIISGMLLLGITLFITAYLLLLFLHFAGKPFNRLDINLPFLTSIFCIYLIFGYFNAFRRNYSFLGFSYRMLLFLIMGVIELLLFFYVILGIATGWDGNAEIRYLL